MAKTLGEFERLILFAILDLEDDEAYGVLIREVIERRTGERCSSGAVYTTLERLEEHGLVSSTVGDPSPQRGGRRKRFYRIERLGLAALDRSTRVHEGASRGLVPKLRSRLAATVGAKGRP